MILRELIAYFGIKYDSRGMKKADAAVTGLRARIQGLGAAFAGIGPLLATLGGTYAFKRLIEMGSDANETLNVLGEVFKHNQKDVEAWASRFAHEVGRSEYEMREIAGTLGAVLNPLMGGNADAAAEMSTNLAQLATDLGSFYNAADQDVLIALRAGITGEAEPMKRYGVVMLDTTLQEFALAKGIRKKYKEMTIAEKTQLRYQYLMANTTAAQGDALRTADGYANAIKGVEGAFKDMATKMMLYAMPAIAQLTSKIRDGLQSFTQMAMKSNLLKATLVVLGGVAAVVALKLLAPWLPLIALAGAAVLAIDEVITLFEGGKTVIGEYIDSVKGIGATQQYVDNHREGVRILGETWEDLKIKVRNIMLSISDSVAENAGHIGESFNWVSKQIERLIGWFETLSGVKVGVAERLKNIPKLALKGMPILGPLVQAYEEYAPEPGAEEELRKRKYAAERGLNADVLKGPTRAQANRQTAEEYRALADAASAVEVMARKMTQAGVGEKEQQQRIEATIKKEGMDPERVWSFIRQREARFSAPARLAAQPVITAPGGKEKAGKSVQQNVDTDIHVSVPAGSKPEDVAQAVVKAFQPASRKMFEELKHAMAAE